MQSVHEIDLTPKVGKHYWKNCHREWREEFIYFLLVERFHDDHNRKPLEAQQIHSGFDQPDELQKICGGTLNGIINHLDYVHDLGCTALWLSPVFQNNPESYHGYSNLAEALKSAAHPERLAILHLMSNCDCDQMKVKTIYETLQLEQSITSRHLGIMKKAGLLKREIKNGKILYYLNKESEIAQSIKKLLTERT